MFHIHCGNKTTIVIVVVSGGQTTVRQALGIENESALLQRYATIDAIYLILAADHSAACCWRSQR